MPDNIDRYVPEFDEQGTREKLGAFDRDQLIEMLLLSYKRTRLSAKLVDEAEHKLSAILALIESPSELLRMPGIPGPKDLRKMIEGDEPL